MLKPPPGAPAPTWAPGSATPPRGDGYQPSEAIGIVRAASSAGVPAAISFTTETDGRLPGGESLAEAITQVDAAASPAYFQVNCAHLVHVAAALVEPGSWRERIYGVRYNASTRSH
jgi:homocysteine S-methyltransferase